MPDHRERRAIGATALDVPVLGFGTAPLGELYGRLDERDCHALMDAAWDGGIRFYDTAPWYGRGMSEHRLGGLLRQKRREDFVVTTKVGRILHRPKDPQALDRSPWTGGFAFEVEFDYTYDGFMRAYEQTLMRLGLDTVDALVIHDLDLGYQGGHLAERQAQLTASGIKALEELKRSGEIAAIGMGINTAESLETTAGIVDLDFLIVAMPYTLLDQASLHTGMANAARRGVGVIIGSPFASGILATGSGSAATYGYSAASAEVQAKVRGIERVCAAHGVGLAAAALQFPLAHPAVAAVIPGAAKASEVEANIASMRTPIPAGFWADLRTEGLIDPDAPVPSA